MSRLLGFRGWGSYLRNSLRRRMQETTSEVIPLGPNKNNILQKQETTNFQGQFADLPIQAHPVPDAQWRFGKPKPNGFQHKTQNEAGVGKTWARDQEFLF